jgi:hypothetical protein
MTMDKEIIANLQKQIQEEKNFTDHSTAEYPVEVILNKLGKGEIYVPNWQRLLRWDDQKKSKFIESILLNIPIPYMFYGVVNGRLEIIDGRQRTGTLEEFTQNKFEIVELEKLSYLKGFRFNDLPSNLQLHLMNRVLRVIMLSEKATEDTRRDIFERINTGSEKLVDAEIRAGIYHGEFYKFIIQCSQNKLLQTLCPMSNSKKKKKEYEELVLRFFTYSEKYLDFQHDVAKFLNQYIVEKNKMGFDKILMEDQLNRMLSFIEKYCPHIFKHEKMNLTPRLRFEAISVGTNLALDKNPNLIPKNFDWVNSSQFFEHIKADGRNSGSYMKSRIEFVRDSILKSAK